MGWVRVWGGGKSGDLIWAETLGGIVFLMGYEIWDMEDKVRARGAGLRVEGNGVGIEDGVGLNWSLGGSLGERGWG